MKINRVHRRFVPHSECRIYGGQYQFLIEADKPVNRYFAKKIQGQLGFPERSYGLLDVHTRRLTDDTWLSTWYCFATKTEPYDRLASSSTARYNHGNCSTRELTT